MNVCNSRLLFVGSCNGLLCVSDYHETLVLYNPSIRKLKTLPVSGTDTKTTHYNLYGFCYDEISDDLKVVELNIARNQASMYHTKVKVYSSRNDSWTKIENDYDGLICIDVGQSVGGILHWKICLIEGYKWTRLIFAVNTVTNMYDTLEPPKDVEKDGVIDWRLGELNGSLVVFCDKYETCLDVWEMKEYGVKESWSKVVSIVYPADPSRRLCPLFVIENAEFCLNYGPYTVLYNSRNNSFTTHQIQSIGGVCSVAALLYIESLVEPSFFWRISPSKITAPCQASELEQWCIVLSPRNFDIVLLMVCVL